MPIGGSAPNKTFTRQINAFTGSDSWEQLEASGRDIISADQDYEGNDIATALNACLFKNGDNFNADIPTSGQKFTGVGNATARTHFAAAGQVQDGSFLNAGASSGTDTITATLSPAITAYADGQTFRFRAGGTNTGAATINFNSVGAADIKKGPDGTTALAAGDITTGGVYFVSYNSGTSDFELINPGTQNVTVTTAGAALLDDADASAQRTTLDVPSNAEALLVANDLSDVNDAATAFGNIKQAASDSATGAIEIAVQSEMEAASSASLAVTPGRQHFHPGHPKAGGSLNGSGTPALASGDYGLGAVTDNGTGNYSIAFDTAFANTNFWMNAVGEDNTNPTVVMIGTKATSSVQVIVRASSNGTAVDRDNNGLTFWGDYA